MRSGLVDVEEVLAMAHGPAGRTDMYRMLVVGAYADARRVLKMSSSSLLELKEDCRYNGPRGMSSGSLMRRFWRRQPLVCLKLVGAKHRS